MELYRKYRPKSFDDVRGQREAVGVMKGWLAKNSVPHAIILNGPSGCSKTTLSRILAEHLGATTSMDYQEINVAEERGVDMVSILGDDVRHNITGHNRVWVLDEMQAGTKGAMQSLLKKLEEAPDYAYFILCTTDPQKLLPTLVNRCSQLQIKPLDETALDEIITRVLRGEQREIPDEVKQAIIRYADGSGRKALVKLEQCLAATQPGNMLALIEQEEKQDATIKSLCEILMGKEATWRETAKIYNVLEGEAETIRRSILGWVASALAKGWAFKTKDALIADILRIFQFNTYDGGKSQLILMVYDAWHLTHK